MIFRRSNDLTASKAPAATSTSGPSATNRQAATYTPSSPSASTTPQLTPMNPSQSNPMNRRTPNAQPTGFNRPEQLRKLTVGRDISLNGEITTCDHLIVEGNVAATIKGGQVLEISETGTFSGLVDIEQADIAGIFDGELTVRGKLILRPTAVVTGLIHYGRLQVDAGATLNGQINALPAAATDTTTTTSSTAPTQTATTNTTKTEGTYYNSLASVNDQPGFLKASA